MSNKIGPNMKFQDTIQYQSFMREKSILKQSSLTLNPVSQLVFGEESVQKIHYTFDCQSSLYRMSKIILKNNFTYTYTLVKNYKNPLFIYCKFLQLEDLCGVKKLQTVQVLNFEALQMCNN